MTKAIAQLWNGELDPMVYSGKDNLKIKRLLYTKEQCWEKLEKGLDGELKELLKKYEDCTDRYNLETSEQAFCDGFSIGAKLVIEALTNADQLL